MQVGGCDAAVTARERVGWLKFKECGELIAKLKKVLA